MEKIYTSVFLCYNLDYYYYFLVVFLYFTKIEGILEKKDLKNPIHWVASKTTKYLCVLT